MNSAQLNALSGQNRNDAVVFVDEGHLYLYAEPVDPSVPSLVSTTTLLHKFFEPFDEDKTIHKILSNPDKKESARHYQLNHSSKKPPQDCKACIELLKQEWEDARTHGKALHAMIENHVKTAEIPRRNSENSPYYDQFLNYLHFRKENAHITIIKVEYVIYNSEAGYAGQIDALAYDKKEKCYCILDWKRTTNIYFWGAICKNEFLLNHRDGNYTHYSMQLGLYKNAIVRFYPEFSPIGYCAIVHFPRKGKERYKIHRTINLDDTIKRILEQREKMLNPKIASASSSLYEQLLVATQLHWHCVGTSSVLVAAANKSRLKFAVRNENSVIVEINGISKHFRSKDLALTYLINRVKSINQLA